MLFTSFEYLYFLVIVLIAYWSIPQRYRWILLLLTSYFFYISWEPTYIILILLSTSIDYFLCRYLIGGEEKRKRRTGLILSVVMNLGLLFTFKYYNFFQDALHDILGLLNIKYEAHTSGLLLPVGISFYTFQTLSYSIDVYRKNYDVEKHFGKFALYVSFFPQLVAGPIERASSLLPQFSKKKLKLKAELFRDGALLFLWGLFKKIVVADNLRVLVDHVFDNPEVTQSGGAVLFALFAFTIQIYADFSGYSDMAIGSAKMFGIDLQMNFRTPYFSKSFTEFWNRWHITLSQWLRDYLFVPLGGLKRNKVRSYSVLFLTFVLAGMWHGASWNFFIWGVISGFIILLERLTGWRKAGKNKTFNVLRALFNFSLVALTTLPFRSIDLNQTYDYAIRLSKIGFQDTYLAIAENMYTPGMLGILVLFLTDLLFAQKSILGLNKHHWSIRYSWTVIIILLILFLGDNASEQFLYFQF